MGRFYSLCRKSDGPKNRHLRETLGIPDAHERSELRKRDGIIGDDKMGFALVTTKRCGSLL